MGTTTSRPVTMVSFTMNPILKDELKQLAVADGQPLGRLIESLIQTYVSRRVRRVVHGSAAQTKAN